MCPNFQRLQIFRGNFCIFANSVSSSHFKRTILRVRVILLVHGYHSTFEYCSIKRLLWPDNQSVFKLHNDSVNILRDRRLVGSLHDSSAAGDVENRRRDWPEILQQAKLLSVPRVSRNHDNLPLVCHLWTENGTPGHWKYEVQIFIWHVLILQ